MDEGVSNNKDPSHIPPGTTESSLQENPCCCTLGSTHMCNRQTPAQATDKRPEKQIHVTYSQYVVAKIAWILYKDPIDSNMIHDIFPTTVAHEHLQVAHHHVRDTRQ